MGISERKEKEKAEMRKMILEAAIQLFIKDGYDGVSIRKIASKIEYSPGTIYTYFEDKDSIFYALHVEGFEMLYQKQLSVQSIKDPRERLIAHGRVYIEFALENQQYYDVMFIIKGPEEIICKNQDWDHGLRSYDLLRRNVAECQYVGIFKDQNTESAAFLLWSTVHGIASLAIRRGVAIKNMSGVEREQLVQNALSVFETFY
jgi:AcrR family transcriptional regulator